MTAAYATATAMERSRVQRWLALAAIAVLPWLIAPGRVQPDTKVDLTISPWTYLLRSLTAWNDHAGLGELQNQAYGYLFPMGPVMGIAHTVGLPGWAAQRVWWMILLLVAFTGAERLVRRLRVTSAPWALVAGAAYALSPRVLTVLAEISAEAWPLALAPWLVLAAIPLTERGSGRGTRVRAAAHTGLLTAALGGVNATASAVVLLLPLLYLLTAARGTRRPRALAWWSGGVLLGASWWVLPLLVLGRYAYPFLDFIETSRITTAVTSVPNTLRGASDWVAYILDAQRHPVWQGGWTQAQGTVAIIASCVVAGLGAAGLVGLARRAHRTGQGSHVARFALAGVLLGTVLMAIGHPGAVGGPLAPTVQHLLDGPLAPLRNVHKADPVLRLPLVLGLAFVLGLPLRRRLPGARLVITAALVVLLASATALWSGRIGDAGSYEAVPADWHQVARAIDADARTAHGSTLLLPASRNAAYTWGTATDEPLSALATSPVVVRASAPLGDPAATRILDRVDALAASGEPQPGLAPALARMGIARIVVRHDLAASVGAEPWRLVERTLSGSPGFTIERTLGELTLWRVAGTAATVTAYNAASRIGVRGGPESSVDLAAAGLLTPDEWIDLGSAGNGARDGAGPDVVTDALRRRAYNNGRTPATAYSPTLQAADPAPTRTGAHDLAPAGPGASEAVRQLVGLTTLSASSTAADPFARAYRGPGAGPAAAVDGDPSTAWVSDAGLAATLRLGLPSGTALHEISIRLASGPGIWTPHRITVSAHPRPALAHAALTRTVPVTDGVARLDLGGVDADTLSVTLLGDGPEAQVGIAELGVAGHPIGSRIHLPGQVDPSQQSVLVRRDPLQRADVPRSGEDGSTLVRTMTTSAGGSMTPSIWLRPVWGTGLDRLLDGAFTVTGSSRADLDPRHRPGAAVQGVGQDAGGWRPAATDPLPTLTIDFGRATHITGLQPSGGGPLTALRVVHNGRTTRLGPGGGSLDLTTRTLTVQLVPGAHQGSWTAPGLTIGGASAATAGVVSLPCGAAGELTIGGTGIPLAAQATRAELMAGNRISATLCGRSSMPVAGGEVTLSAAAGSGVQTEAVLLRPSSAHPHVAPSPRTVHVDGDATGRHTVTVGPGAPAVVALAQGANAGWRATTPDGRALTPVTVDGWRQGFRLPDRGTTTVTIEFAPTTAHRIGLGVGLLAVLILLVAAAASRRRPGGAAEVGEVVAGTSPAHGGTGTRLAEVAGVLLVSVLVAGWAGALVGVVALAVPRRWLAPVGLAGMSLAGLGMAALGVVDQQSSGAIAGQLLGTLTLAVLARALWPDAPSAARAAPAAAQTPTTAPPSTP